MANKRLHLIVKTPIDVDTEKISKDKLTAFLSVVEILGLNNALTLYGGITRALHTVKSQAMKTPLVLLLRQVYRRSKTTRPSSGSNPQYLSL